MLIKFCPASPHVCPGGCVCVCVLTAANFSYMSIFLHIRSLTHRHTHGQKKLVEVLLGQGTKMFLAHAVAHLWPPGRDSAIFGFSTSTTSVATKDLTCWPRHTHTDRHRNTRVLPLLRKTMSRKHSSIDP